jgi:hypothetical protein
MPKKSRKNHCHEKEKGASFLTVIFVLDGEKALVHTNTSIRNRTV